MNSEIPSFRFWREAIRNRKPRHKANGTLSVTGEVTHTAFCVPCSQTVSCLLFVACLSSVFFFIVPKQQSAPLVSIDKKSYCFIVTLSSAVSSLHLSILLVKSNESFQNNLISNINLWRTRRNMLYRVRKNYRRILKNHIFTNTEQKYVMLLPSERGMFADS